MRITTSPYASFIVVDGDLQSKPLDPEDLHKVPVGTLFEESPSSLHPSPAISKKKFIPGINYNLTDLLSEDQLDIEQRIQAFKYPLFHLRKIKRFMGKQALARFCSNEAEVIFAEDGKTIDRFKVDKTFKLPNEYKRNHASVTNREANMYALSKFGYKLFPYPIERYSKLFDLFDRMVNMKSLAVLKEVDEIEKTL